MHYHILLSEVDIIKTAIKLFEQKLIRTHWDDEKKK